MKFKFKKLTKKQKDDYTFKGCDVCCLVGKKECKTAPCGGGYMIEIKRPTKYERLLKALLKVCDSGTPAINGYNRLFHKGRIFDGLTKEVEKQLIAIKERMEKGAKV